MTEEKQDAIAVQDAAVAAPTLDEFMRRDPASMDKQNRRDMVELLRQARPVYIKAEAERKSRKKNDD